MKEFLPSGEGQTEDAASLTIVNSAASLKHIPHLAVVSQQGRPFFLQGSCWGLFLCQGKGRKSEGDSFPNSSTKVSQESIEKRSLCLLFF